MTDTQTRVFQPDPNDTYHFYISPTDLNAPLLAHLRDHHSKHSDDIPVTLDVSYHVDDEFILTPYPYPPIPPKADIVEYLTYTLMSLNDPRLNHLKQSGATGFHVKCNPIQNQHNQYLLPIEVKVNQYR